MQTLSMSIPGSNIRTLRRQLGLSQRALARAAGLDSGGMSRVESGEQGLSKDALERVAAALHVSLGVLYSEPAEVEAAALRMRRVRILTAAQLLVWPNDSSGESDDDPCLFADLSAVSAFAFALRIEDFANAPDLLVGDEVIFDAKRIPQTGMIVAAQNADAVVFIGRFLDRSLDANGELSFEVIPHNLTFGIGQSRAKAGLRLRGTLAELRRSFPKGN